MERIIEFLLYSHGPVPYIAAFTVLLICGLGVPIPEDLTLFAMGLISYYGLADLKISILVCFIGVLLGDSIVFWLGYHYGVKITKHRIVAKLIHPERMDRTRALFHKWGNRVIFLARFMPGLRAPTFFFAGTMHLPFRIFISYDGLAALISVPLFVSVTYYFGDQVDRIIHVVRKVEHGIAFVVLGLIALLVAKHFISKSRKKS